MDAPTLVPSVQAHNPFRLLDWRWRRAESLAGLRGRPARDDPETAAAASYLRVEQYGGRRPPARSRAEWPAIRAAHELADRDDPLRTSGSAQHCAPRKRDVAVGLPREARQVRMPADEHRLEHVRP